MTAAARTAEPSAAAAAADIVRVELIEESADLAIPFLVGVRQAARDGDVARLGECLRALWLAAVVMRKTYRELGQSGGDPEAPR